MEKNLCHSIQAIIVGLRPVYKLLKKSVKQILGFGDRLLSELRRPSPKDTKIRISAPQERLYSTWIGGSILASLDNFKRIWVTKKEWEQEGARVLHRKSL